MTSGQSDDLRARADDGHDLHERHRLSRPRPARVGVRMIGVEERVGPEERHELVVADVGDVVSPHRGHVD